MGRGAGWDDDGMAGEVRAMNCIMCWRKATLIRDLEEHCGFHYEAWECECGAGWVYRDGVLAAIGKAWETWKAIDIPKGTLAVLGKERKVWTILGKLI